MNFILYYFPSMNYSDVTSLLRNLLSRTRTPKWLMIFTRYLHIYTKKRGTEKRWRLVWYPTWFGAFIRPLHQAISRIKTPCVRSDKPRQPALWKLMTDRTLKFYGLRKHNCFRKLSPMRKLYGIEICLFFNCKKNVFVKEKNVFLYFMIINIV